MVPWTRGSSNGTTPSIGKTSELASASVPPSVWTNDVPPLPSTPASRISRRTCSRQARQRTASPSIRSRSASASARSSATQISAFEYT
jgi:hypothetical protein